MNDCPRQNPAYRSVSPVLTKTRQCKLAGFCFWRARGWMTVHTLYPKEIFCMPDKTFTPHLAWTTRNLSTINMRIMKNKYNIHYVHPCLDKNCNHHSYIFDIWIIPVIKPHVIFNNIIRWDYLRKLYFYRPIINDFIIIVTMCLHWWGRTVRKMLTYQH